MKHPLLLPLVFVLLGTAWNFVVPAYENLDEIEHAEVVRHIAVTGRLPVHGEAQAAGFHVRQEASQPPLYHLLGAAWVRALGLPTSPPTAEPVPGTVVACGDRTTFYNKVTWARDPYRGFPWSGHRQMVYGLRLLSTLLQTLTVWGTWVLARRLFPRGPVALLATGIVAFNPQFLLVSAGVNNDNLVTPLATWALVLLVDLWQRGPTTARLLGFSILSGLAALSKLSGLALLGLGGGVVLFCAWRESAPLGQVVRWSTLLGLPALALIAPWMLRNLRLYGDPTALTPMLEIVGRRTSPLHPLNEFRLVWPSYWGQLPCTFYPRALYWPFALLVGGGLLGLIWKWHTLYRDQRHGLLGLALWFLIIVAAWIRWDLITPAPGGRLLFPAAPALALLMAVGWTRLLRPASRLWAALLPLWALVTLVAGPLHIFAPPPLPSEGPAAVASEPYAFGDAIRLHEYAVRLTRFPFACRLSTPAYCRPTLEVSLAWEARRPIAENYVLAIQLVSAKPGDDSLRLSYNYWPGRGNLPTSAWPVGRIFRDRYRIPLPEGDFVTQAWDVHLAFFDLGTRKRLPVTHAGGSAGDAAPLATLRVPGAPPTCDEMEALTPPVYFGAAVALTHATVTPGVNGWEVTLCWESVAPLAEDYTVFVHAYAAAGALLGTGDGPPMGQAFPTRLWQPGDRILDTHVITASEDGAPAYIAVGFYHPQSGERLPATREDARLPHDAAVIWEAP
ncbi:MAG: ArnT family glycosyltransferase [Anaerolineae bacterium]